MTVPDQPTVSYRILAEWHRFCTVWLYGDLDEEIWMNPNPGIGLQGEILCLRKALYGHKFPYI